jgi:hypothetical protein
MLVNALDLVATRAKLFTLARSVESPWDFNRDGRVNAIDLATVRANAGRQLAAPGVPPPPEPQAAVSYETLQIAKQSTALELSRKHRLQLEIQ